MSSPSTNSAFATLSATMLYQIRRNLENPPTNCIVQAEQQYLINWKPNVHVIMPSMTYLTKMRSASMVYRPNKVAGDGPGAGAASFEKTP